MNKGLVSAIIPVHNRGNMLREAVASVLAQTHSDIEIVIVDDGSTDGTHDVATELCAANPGRVLLLRQKNLGPGAARNLGLARARGEYIQYLDSDDLLEPRKFELQVAALRANPWAGLAYGRTLRVDLATGKTRVWAETGEYIEAMFPDFLMQRGWDTNSPLWRRSTCDAIGPWREFRCLEDWEHDLRAGLVGVHPIRVNAHVATVRDHGGNRASGGSDGYTPALLRDVLGAHEEIWRQMQNARRNDPSYLLPFSRKLFWIARMCGARGMPTEARRALAVAEAMASTENSLRELRVFRAMTWVLGWRVAVALGEGLRWIRSREGGAATHG